MKYTFGVCLYLGWLASVLALVSGCLLLCCHISSGDEDTRGRYKPPQQTPYKPPQVRSNIPMTQDYNSAR